MKFLDSIKQVISDKLDEVLGEEPVQQKPSVVKEPEVEEQEEEVVFDASSLADTSKLGSNVYDYMTGVKESPAIEEDETEFTESSEEDNNIDVSALTSLNFESLSRFEILEEQCGCKLFGRYIQDSELFLDDSMKMHTKVDSSNPVSSVMIALGSALSDLHENSSVVFIGISKSVIYNFVFEDLFEDNSYEVEVREYLTQRVSQLEIECFFYMPYVVMQHKSPKRIKESSLILEYKNEKLLYYFTFNKCREGMSELGRVVNLLEVSSNTTDEKDEEMIELLKQQMYQTLYPMTTYFFKVSSDLVYVLHVCSYIEDAVVDDIAQRVEVVNRTLKTLEV